MAGPRPDLNPDAAAVCNSRRRLAGLLVPAALGRLDAWLRLHHPLVWRTRVHFFLFYGLILGNLLFFALGWVYPLRLTAVPSAAEIALLVTFVTIGGWLVLGLWVLTQWRSPLPETGLRGNVLTLALYWVCILCVVPIPHSFALPLVYRIADLAPEPNFSREYAFHKQYNFWCCHHLLDDALVARHEGEIREALRRYGQGEFGSLRVINLWYCPRLSKPCLVDTDDWWTKRLELGDTLDSIAASKAFREGVGSYHERYAGLAPGAMAWSLLSAAILTLAAQSPSIRSRRLSGAGTGVALRRIRLPRPGPLTELDRRLRVRRPFAWSLGLNATLLYYIVFIAPAFVIPQGLALLAAAQWGVYLVDVDFTISATIAVLLLPSAAWAMRQARAPLDAPNFLRNYTALTIYTLISNWPLILLGAFWSVGEGLVLGDHNDDPIAFAETVFILVSMGFAHYFGGSVLLSQYLSRLPLMVAVASGPLLWIVTFALVLSVTRHPLDFCLATLGIWSLLALLPALARLGRLTRGAAPALAGVSIAYLPLVPYALGMYLVSIFWVPSLPVFAASLVAATSLYLLAATPAIQVLIRYRYQPRPD